jgi:hypothetical protein
LSPFAAPALAGDYYVALKLGGGAAACEVMTTTPDAKTHKMMGKSEAAAKAAMATMKEAAVRGGTPDLIAGRPPHRGFSLCSELRSCENGQL